MAWDFGGKHANTKTENLGSEPTAKEGEDGRSMRPFSHMDGFGGKQRESPHLQSTRAAVAIIDSENVFIDDTLANKYKDNEREIKREQRYT
jgi:hypothetical protein